MLGVLRTVERLKLDTKFPRLVQSCAKVFSEALACQFNDEQRANVSIYSFWRKYRAMHNAYGGDVTAQIDQLQKASGADYGKYLDELNAITQDKVGRAMYQWALPKALAQHIMEYCDKKMVYPEGRLLTLADKHRIIEECIAEAD